MTVPGGQNFSTCYMKLCKQKRLRPLPVICVTLPHSLDFTTDRVKMDDWGPILISLSLDRSLKSVSVRSKYQCRKPLEEINSEKKARAARKTPAVLTRYLLEWLSHSVAQCVRNSPALTCLELEGVPLPADCLAALCVGLAGTETLQHLSFRRCYIGDNSCAMVCRTIAEVHSIRSLNLSQCDLSSSCGPALASALCRQKLLLYHEAWKDSLRYREPNLQTMPGLRRLTLNGNPHLGDTAVAHIIDSIQDSLWMKALDLQNCGLTDAIGNKILELLDHNTILDVVDVRSNSKLSDNIIQDVLRRVEMNNVGSVLEFTLMTLPQSTKNVRQRESKSYKCRTNFETTKVARDKNEISKRLQLGPHKPLPKAKLALPHPPKKTAPKVRPPEAKPAKVSLQLDLQAQIKSVVEDSWKHVHVNQLNNDPKESECEKNNREVEKESDEKLEEILRQLSDAKAERLKLLEETQRVEMELKEERARREVAEMKLRTMQRNLTDLEGVLKAKELESHGSMLASQQSYEEISESFEELLNLLDDLANNPSARWHNGEEEAKADIKRRLTLLIRKTKSENLYRKHASTKFSKSEGHMTCRSSSTLPIPLERNIGDHPDSLNGSSCRRQEKSKPRERARAIFAQIVSGDVILNLGSHVS